MIRLPLLALTSIGICIGLYACSSSSGDDDDGVIPYDGGGDVIYVIDTGADGPDPNSGMGKTFCDATLGVIQNNVGQCCSAAEKTDFSPSLQNTLSNIDALVTGCETTLESSIAQHRTAPNTANYTACENAFKATFVLPGTPSPPGACQGLDQYRDGDVISAACAGAFVGNGVLNDPCAGAFDCGNSLVCVGYGPGHDGQCLSPVPIDGTCGISAGSTAAPVDIVIPPVNQCASGFYCEGNTSCKAQYGNDAGPDGGSGIGCLSDFECNGGFCVDTRCESSAGNAYCAASRDCAPGMFCDPMEPAPNDGGAPAGAIGTCAPSKPNAVSCTNIQGECQGKCGSGSNCEAQCSYPQ